MIRGTLNSTASTVFRIEFFASSAGNEGERYLGFTEVTTDGSGNASFNKTLGANVALGEAITATATDPSGNTSEFSATQSTQAALVVTTTNDIVDGLTTSVADLLGNKGADTFISLREAVLATNADTGYDVIVIPAGTYTLNRTGSEAGDATFNDLDITDDLTLAGAGTSLTFIDGNATDRVLQVHSSTVAVAALTIQNGRLTAGATHGAGIAVEAGAVLSIDTVDVLNNLVTGGSSNGGGIWNAGTITAVDTAISSNSATTGGGGLHNSGTATFSNSLIDGNAAGNGAGIYHTGGSTLDLTNVTVSGNTSSGNGGGLYTESTVNATNITVTDNESTGFSVCERAPVRLPSRIRSSLGIVPTPPTKISTVPRSAAATTLSEIPPGPPASAVRTS